MTFQGPLMMDASTFIANAGGSSGSDLTTETIIFEFSAAAVQQWVASRAGFVLMIKSSTGVYGATVAASLPTTMPNGANTAVWTGWIVADGLQTGSSPLFCRHPFSEGDILQVKATASALINVIVGYPST